MKILNLYAGIGGNRKLWGDEHEITAVENVPEIAAVYTDLFPDDTMLIEDAHEYLLKHYKEYDFIWSSPPCPTHSRMRSMGVWKGQNKAVYPDMTLYQEVLLLKHFASKGSRWIVENVDPYYEPLITPTVRLNRHLVWSNFYISSAIGKDSRETQHDRISPDDVIYGFDLSEYDVPDKLKLLRNMCSPHIGSHILKHAIKNTTANYKIPL